MSDNNGRKPEQTGARQFHYAVMMTIDIDSQEYEFHKEWDTLIQFQVGDIIISRYFDELVVSHVAWAFEHENWAHLELERGECDGPASEWNCLLEEFDYCLPELPVRAEKDNG